MSRRKSFLTCRVRKGTNNEYAVRIARLAGKAHANRLSGSCAEDCWRRGLRRDVSECLARHASGTESWLCVQRCRVVCRRAVLENLPLAGNFGAEIQDLRLSGSLLRLWLRQRHAPVLCRRSLLLQGLEHQERFHHAGAKYRLFG